MNFGLRLGFVSVFALVSTRSSHAQTINVGGIMRFISISVLVFLVGCIASPNPAYTRNNPSLASSQKSAPGPISYQDMSIAEINMTKPIGSHVRTSGKWGGTAMDLRPEEGTFLATLEDGDEFIHVRIPKKFAGQSGKFTKTTDVRVEGECRILGDTKIMIEIVVERFLPSGP